MFRDEDLRKIEVKQPDGSWVEAHMGKLQDGDIIRMFEPDGRPVVYRGDTELKVLCQPSFVIEGEQVPVTA